MMRGAEAIKKKTGWNDLIDAINIKAYLCGDKHDDDMHDAMVEEKRGRTIHEEDVIELENKRRSPRNKEASKEQKTEKKRQMTAKAIMVDALDTRVIVDEEEEIGQVFVQFAMPETRNKVDMENKVSFKHVEGKREHQVECTPLGFTGIRKDAQEVSVNTCSKCENEGIESSSYSVLYWARATTEIYVRLGDFKDPILALVDHGSEIKIIPRTLFDREKWSIDIGQR
uniref:Predicted protein n=1 Tax=Physcomitrium patens TaxID=3218 RepID=A9U6E7_PHYPA